MTHTPAPNDMPDAIFVEEKRLVIDPSVPEDMILFLDEETRQWFLNHIKNSEEHDALFERMWAADMRGIKAWQKKTGKNLTWPSRDKLVEWLLDELENAADLRAPEAVGGEALESLNKLAMACEPLLS